jgi:REP element-mobilizing transposase RayT
MGRKPRVHYAGAIYHVFNRGNGGKDIFIDALDYHRFLDELCALKARGLVIHAYCLMPNHFHLVAEVDEVPMARWMHRLQTAYARYFNYRRNGFGHVFQSRHQANLCDSDAYFKNAVAYVHLNPVSAGLVAAPEDWRWSGHRGLLGYPDPVVCVEKALGLFSDNIDEARRCYQEFVSIERDRPLPDPRVPVRAVSRTLDVILVDCAAEFDMRIERLKGFTRARDVARCRRVFSRRALDAGYQRTEIAAFLQCTPGAITHMLNSGGNSNGYSL